jgi:hypothetical protein
LLLLAGGCIEYQPASTVPPVGVANPRPLETPRQTDKLVQVQVPEVDILWTIDNSCSMFEEQTALAENFPVFMDFFLGSGLDYQIGVVSTDVGDNGKLETANGYKWIDEDTDNPSAVFSAMAVLGTSGSGIEKGRDQAYDALEIKTQPDKYNEGFIRDDAALHLVFVSDEDDQSAFARPEFVSYLKTLKWSEDMVTSSSIVSPNPVCPAAATPGDEYIAVTNAVGGIFWSICSEEWVELLENLGIQASGLKREYFLSQLPVLGTIEVWVVENGVTYTFLEDVDWVYDEQRNSIGFNEYVPGALAEVFVEYDVLSAIEGDL